MKSCIQETGYFRTTLYIPGQSVYQSQENLMITTSRDWTKQEFLLHTRDRKILQELPAEPRQCKEELQYIFQSQESSMITTVPMYVHTESGQSNDDLLYIPESCKLSGR